jgi:hypothetical protein
MKARWRLNNFMPGNQITFAAEEPVSKTALQATVGQRFQRLFDLHVQDARRAFPSDAYRPARCLEIVMV